MTGYTLGLVGWVWDDLAHLEQLPGAAPAHTLMLLGLLLAAIGLPFARAWRWFLVGVAGVALGGQVVDAFWHQAHPGAEASNMLLLSGHLVQLAGRFAGLGLDLAARAHPG
jgi:hypothetical protein